MQVEVVEKGPQEEYIQQCMNSTFQEGHQIPGILEFVTEVHIYPPSLAIVHPKYLVRLKAEKSCLPKNSDLGKIAGTIYYATEQINMTPLILELQIWDHLVYVDLSGSWAGVLYHKFDIPLLLDEHLMQGLENGILHPINQMHILSLFSSVKVDKESGDISTTRTILPGELLAIDHTKFIPMLPNQRFYWNWLGLGYPNVLFLLSNITIHGMEELISKSNIIIESSFESYVEQSKVPNPENFIYVIEETRE